MTKMRQRCQPWPDIEVCASSAPATLMDVIPIRPFFFSAPGTNSLKLYIFCETAKGVALYDLISQVGNDSRIVLWLFDNGTASADLTSASGNGRVLPLYHYDRSDGSKYFNLLHICVHVSATEFLTFRTFPSVKFLSPSRSPSQKIFQQ
jgi:hypothetical protein